MEIIKRLIRTIPDFPRPGIQFRDVTTLLSDGEGFRHAIEVIASRHPTGSIDKIAGIEARGFVFGAAAAHRLGVGFIPVRKQGKLPFAAIGRDYELEYGTDRIEIHADAVVPGERVLLIDDLIATGGTAEAAAMLLCDAGAHLVECCFVVELPALGGRRRLVDRGHAVFSVCEFEGH
jgi:adenine phosphoribosyltransferase